MFLCLSVKGLGQYNRYGVPFAEVLMFTNSAQFVTILIKS